ncbi:helicase associated domain-containing protein [Streptomyces sp. NBC_01637]|uniref:helicase associated domain-containing protein n=1 Tax=unclassified Streptomyces TaxID=2593676 RepID=UPI00386C36CA
MVPVGQHLANLRRKGGLGKDAERAVKRAQQLAAIDPDWKCPWPLDWQRHYKVLAELVDADGVLPAIEPGVLFEGDDLGKWLERQKQPGAWAQLLPEQQERLSALGVRPAERPIPAAKAAKGGGQGVSGLPARRGSPGAVHRTGGHSEEITVDGETEPVSVRLGVFMSNTKARRDKLSEPQRAALAELGVEWV